MSQINLVTKSYSLETDQLFLNSPFYKIDSSYVFQKTVACTGARILADAAQVSGDMVGFLRRINIRPTGLKTLAAAGATDSIKLIGVLPLLFRPDINLYTDMTLYVNNIPVVGARISLTTAGDIIFTASPSDATFTSGQICGILNDFSFTYHLTTEIH